MYVWCVEVTTKKNQGFQSSDNLFLIQSLLFSAICPKYYFWGCILSALTLLSSFPVPAGPWEGVIFLTCLFLLSPRCSASSPVHMSSLFVLSSWFHDTFISMFIVFAWMFSYRADGKSLLTQQETILHHNYTCCWPFHFPSAFDEIVFSKTLWILSPILT